MKKPVGFTRKQFTKMYGPHPDWLWDMLVQNYKNMIKEWKNKKNELIRPT